MENEHRPPRCDGDFRPCRRRWLLLSGREPARRRATGRVQDGRAARRTPWRTAPRALHAELEPHRCRPELLREREASDPRREPRRAGGARRRWALRHSARFRRRLFLADPHDAETHRISCPAPRHGDRDHRQRSFREPRRGRCGPRAAIGNAHRPFAQRPEDWAGAPTGDGDQWLLEDAWETADAERSARSRVRHPPARRTVDR